MKTHSCDQTRGSKPGMMMQKGSHTISKEKPKIRIIHIVAPEIIKTDVDNFRALVQRLTGQRQPLGKGCGGNMKKGEKKTISSSSMQRITQGKKKNTVLQKTDGNNANAFLSFLGDGFMHGMSNNNIHDFPLLQFRSNSQSLNF